MEKEVRLFGGQSDEFLNDFYVLTCKTKKWKQIPKNLQSGEWPSKRTGASMFYHNDNVYIYGGMSGQGKGALGDVYR